MTPLWRQSLQPLDLRRADGRYSERLVGSDSRIRGHAAKNLSWTELMNTEAVCRGGECQLIVRWICIHSKNLIAYNSNLT